MDFFKRIERIELEASKAAFRICLMSQIRKDAGVSNQKATIRKCWRLEDGQQVKLLEYSKGWFS